LIGVRQRLRELAQTRVRFGYRRLLVLMRREGWELGKKRLYRLYTEEGLSNGLPCTEAFDWGRMA